jgi:hypothetical protein
MDVAELENQLAQQEGLIQWHTSTAESRLETHR